MAVRNFNSGGDLFGYRSVFATPAAAMPVVSYGQRNEQTFQRMANDFATARANRNTGAQGGFIGGYREGNTGHIPAIALRNVFGNSFGDDKFWGAFIGASYEGETGAKVGYRYGGPYGAVIGGVAGAVVGGVAGYLSAD